MPLLAAASEALALAVVITLALYGRRRYILAVSH